MTSFLGMTFFLATILLTPKLSGDITIAHGEDMVDKVVGVTREITGDHNLPNTGILVVLQVTRA